MHQDVNILAMLLVGLHQQLHGAATSFATFELRPQLHLQRTQAFHVLHLEVSKRLLMLLLQHLRRHQPRVQRQQCDLELQRQG